MNGRAGGAARQDRPDAPARRVAELEVENAALRRALASAGRAAAPEAAAAAARAEGAYGRLLEAAPNPYPYLVLHPDAPRFTIAAASDAYLRATMTRRGEILGRGVFEALTDDPARPEATGVRNLRASLERVLASRAPDRMPVQRYDIREPGGGAFEERHWSPLNLPVLAAGGGVEAIIHHVEDVTAFVRLREGAAADHAETREARARAGAMEAEALRQAREAARANAELGAANAALRDSERRLRATQDHAGVGIHEVDADGRYVRVNGTFTRMSGYTQEDFAGRAFWEFIEDEADRRDARDAFARLVQGQIERFVAERAYTAKHGRRWWAEVTTTAIRDERGRFLYAVRVVHDATERRRAEERLREVEARQTFLLRLSDALRPLRDAADIQAEACRLLGQHLGVAQVGFGQIDAAEERVTVHRDWNDGRVPSVVGTWRMDDFGPAFVAAMKRGETVAIPDIALDPRTGAPEVAAAYAGIGTRAVLDVPLVKGGRMVAMLFIHHPEPRRWSPAEVEVVGETCERLWAAVERAHAEAALRENEARLAAILEHLPVGVGITDRAGRLVLGNPALRRFVEERVPFADPAARGRWVGRHPDGSPIEPRDFAAARALRGETVSPGIEFLLHGADGAAAAGPPRWTRVAAVPVRGPDGGGGAPSGAVVLVEDIHDRKTAETRLAESRERLEAVVAHAAVGVAQVDLEGRFLLVNDLQCEILGRSREELLRDGGPPMLEVTHPEDRPGNAALLRRMLDTGEPFAIEKRYLRPDGSAVWVHNHVSLTRGADGRPRYVTALVQDITERRKAEERRALLVNELNHRVKNTLAVVQSIALQTARGAADLSAFTAAFQERLIALARAHDLLTRKSWEGAPLGEVARAALEGSGARVGLGGCSSSGALLPPAQALALAMALHELATNALKHGALSAPEGRVAIACRADDGAQVVEWVERGGPRISGPPARKGFGLRLLERGLATQAGVAADLRFEPEGLRCTLRLPPLSARSPTRQA